MLACCCGEVISTKVTEENMKTNRVGLYARVSTNNGHSGLYSRGRLIHGRSIHGDAPGHEGENLRRICEELARKLDKSE